MSAWPEFLSDPNMRWILSGCMLLGLGSGVIGSFAYLRKQSLMGDALSHAALPGVCIAFLITGTKSLLGFLIGAAAAGVLATLAIHGLSRYTRIKPDSAIAAVLSVFFGLGIVLLTDIQHGGSGNQSGLDKFLFGQAATMVMSDVYAMMAVSALLIGLCTLLFKEFKLVSFDPAFARGLGFPSALLDQLLMLLIVVAVVVGIQAVGVVLMAALLITPAVSARYWTERLSVMVVLSGAFGAVSGIVGTLASAQVAGLPTGPAAVLCATAVFVLSLLFGPRKGFVAQAVVRGRARRAVAAEARYGRKEEAL